MFRGLIPTYTDSQMRGSPQMGPTIEKSLFFLISNNKKI